MIQNAVIKVVDRYLQQGRGDERYRFYSSAHISVLYGRALKLLPGLDFAVPGHGT